MKNVAAFYPCPKSLPEAEVKSFGLIPLAEEMSKHPGIDSVMCLLVVALIKIYNEKGKAEQGKLQNIKSKKKGFTKNWHGAKACVQGNKEVE